LEYEKLMARFYADMWIPVSSLNSFKACGIRGNVLRFDFAGLAALVGFNATKAGIRYTCLVRSRVPYLNAYVPVGTLGLAQAVLSCISWRPARILIGAEEGGSMLELCGIKASGNATYVGLQSATLPVRGIVGETVVVELLRQAKERDCSPIGRDSGRPTTVVWAEIQGSDNIYGDVHVVGDEGALINYGATSVCVIVLALEALCREWFAFSLVATGMLLNTMMAFLLRVQKFELPSAKPADGVPPGDAVIVLKDDPDVFCVLRGTEEAMQKLLLKEVVINAGWVEHLPLFLVSVALVFYSAVLVLGVPHLRPTSQLLFLIVVCVGALTDLMKGSWIGRRGIAKEALVKYAIQIVDVKKFGNRTASVACVAAGCKQMENLKAAGLCPTTGTVWQSWWDALEILETNEKGEVQKKLDTLSTSVREEDKNLWNVLQKDMSDGRTHAMLKWV
jgi:hypothetical protein